MSTIRFEWDQAKNLSNRRKHGLSFEEAVQVFRDPLHVSIPERIEDGEERWQTFGVIEGMLLVVVAHTLREDEPGATVVHVISARFAVRKERRFYEDQSG